ncbi:hypothetical protein Tco_0798395 [Tanacetum coccineum]
MLIKRRKPHEFSWRAECYLKVSPWKGVVRFGKKGKLAPRYVGPFEIVECVGPVAYRLKLPQELSCVHDTFHVSNLKKCLAEPDVQVPLDEIEIDENLRFVEEPIEIVERDVKKLKRRRIPLVKVRWNSRQGAEYTWEREDQFRKKYPNLFSEPVLSSSLTVVISSADFPLRLPDSYWEQAPRSPEYVPDPKERRKSCYQCTYTGAEHPEDLVPAEGMREPLNLLLPTTFFILAQATTYYSLRTSCEVGERSAATMLARTGQDPLWPIESDYSLEFLMETEARMSREAWGRSMDASDLARAEVMSLRTTVHAQMSEITELQSADRSRQRAISDLLETDRGRREEMRELRAADRTRQQQIIQTLTVMQTLQREMIPLQGLVTTLQGQVTALQGQVMALQGQVTALQGQQGPAGGPAQPELPEEAGSSS